MAKRKERNQQPKAISPKDATREALDFCFEDVSSLRMLGSAPLSDLTSEPGQAAASGAGRAPNRGGTHQRWNVVVLALLVLTLAATTAATLLGR